MSGEFEEVVTRLLVDLEVGGVEQGRLADLFLRPGVIGIVRRVDLDAEDDLVLLTWHQVGIEGKAVTLRRPRDPVDLPVRPDSRDRRVAVTPEGQDVIPGSL